MNLLSARDRLRLERDCSAGTKENRKEGDQSRPRLVRQARLDRRRVHGEESVAFSGSVAVELDSGGSIVSTFTEHYVLKMLHHTYTTTLIVKKFPGR